MEYLSSELKNGIRLVHYPVKSEIAYCGILVNTGSRDEEEHEHGMAHFIEHMLFKGTRKRKPFHILSRMEDVGGEINAYTTKEETCVYTSFLKGDYSRAIELLSDIFIRSTFPSKEMIREKEVIIDEINSYKDSPGELIFDDFEEQIFPGHSIGKNILGTPDSVRNFKQQDIFNFLENNYNTDQIVFCSVGNISMKLLTKYFAKYFSEIPFNTCDKARTFSEAYKPTEKIEKMDTWQSHCILGTTAYDIRSNKRIGLYLLNNILGGQGLSSRLNMSLREKKGYAYNIESSYSPYCDTGVLSIYFGTDPENLNKSIKLAKLEMRKLRETKLGSVQLIKAQRQMIGQLARSRENHESLLFSMGKSHLLFNKFDGVKELTKKIEAVSGEEIMEIANEILAPERLSTLIYK